MSIRNAVSSHPWILALATLGVVAAWMLSGIFQTHNIEEATSQILAPGSDEPNVKVQVRNISLESVTRFININGKTEPARTVQISAETEGRVVSVQAPRGTRVRAGDIILKLDLRDRAARIEQAQASVNEHQTSYQGQLSLQKQGYVSDTQIAETLAKLETAKTELLRAQLDLANMEIRAPYDGVLQDRLVEVGDFVRIGDQVATFVDNTKIIVTGSVAEQDVGNLRTGLQAQAKLVTGQAPTGRVRYISPVADDATRTFLIELEIDNSDGSLPAGVTADMRLPAGEILAQKVSPALLVLDSDGTIGVNIVDDLDRVKFAPVSIVNAESDGVWLGGLPDESRIIVVGQGYVFPGQQVVSVPADIDAETALAAGSK